MRTSALATLLLCAACSSSPAGTTGSTGHAATTTHGTSASAAATGTTGSTGHAATTTHGTSASAAATGTTGESSTVAAATGSTTGGSTATGGSAGTTGFVPFPHRPPAPLQDHGGARMSGLTLVTITASNDPLAAELAAFSDGLSQSAWLSAVLAPYGLAPPAASLHVPNGPAITTALEQSDVIAYIQALISAQQAPAPDGNTLYLLFVPPAGALAGTGFIGYHNAFPSNVTSIGDSFAVVSVETGLPPTLTTFEQLTQSASHEILESATDPNLNGLFVGPYSEQPWTAPVSAAWQSDQVEVGDLCEGTLTLEGAGDAGIAYQRIFDNLIALDGGDNPCVPLAPGPYYNVTVPQDWFPVQAGATLTIPFTGWSSAPSGDWLVFAATDLVSPAFDAGLPQPILTTDGGLGNGPPCYSRYAMNNGVPGTLTFQMLTDAQPGDWGVLRIDSFIEGAGPDSCDTPGTGDQYHRWLVGVYVPVPDAGTTLPPSPLSCAYLTAAFGGDGQLYQICGDEPGYGLMGLVQAYSPTAQSWGSAPSLPPGPASNFAAATGPDGRIYVVDGWDGESRYARLEAFDTASQTWTVLPPPPQARDNLAAAFGPDGRLYVVGGYDGTQQLTTVEIYDLDAGWSDGPPLPVPADYLSAATGGDGRIYVFGGQNALDGGLPSLATVQAYDVGTQTWDSTSLVLPHPRTAGAAITDANGNIYLVGGHLNLDGGWIPTIPAVDLLSTATGSWSSAPYLPSWRDELAGALGPDGNVYMVGGLLLDDVSTGELNAYSETCGCWQ